MFVYRRQTEEIASVVEKLSEEIDALVKQYFEDFEKYVLDVSKLQGI